MSEYWVSKKRYFCKYCEIYITDDAPSRQHHENGLRHKGNVERFIRGIYKTGEKRKKDQEEEKREMARVEQAAQAAFAQDLSLGHAKASSTTIASSSTAPRKPTTKPSKHSDPFSNYSTAAQLGYTDPDMEEMQIRKSQGLVGEWQVVEPMHAHGDEEKDVKPPECTHGTYSVSATESISKRAAEPHPDDDSRAFKLRKKTAAVGLGDIYDPGVIPIKKKKKEDTTLAEVPLLTTPIPSSSNTELPKWTAISLKGKDSSVFSSSIPKTERFDGQSSQSTTEEAQPQASRWAKVSWTQPIKEEDTAVAPAEQPSQDTPVSGLTDKESAIKSEENPPSTVKAEVDESSTLEQPLSLFKKRKAPANAGRGRRPF